MKIKRKYRNSTVLSTVEIELIKQYDRYGLYQVYKVFNR